MCNKETYGFLMNLQRELHSPWTPPFIFNIFIKTQILIKLYPLPFKIKKEGSKGNLGFLFPTCRNRTSDNLITTITSTVKCSTN